MDFVLVLLVVVPVVLGILQLGLVLHVRNTVTAAASEGARHAATVDRAPADGVRRTRELIDEADAGRFVRQVEVRRVSLAGRPAVRVTVHAEVPPLGLWGPAAALQASGHAVEEVAP